MGKRQICLTITHLGVLKTTFILAHVFTCIEYAKERTRYVINGKIKLSIRYKQEVQSERY